MYSSDALDGPVQLRMQSGTDPYSTSSPSRHSSNLWGELMLLLARGQGQSGVH
jgi:hypothetical protein